LNDNSIVYNYHTLRDNQKENVLWPTINEFNNVMSCKSKTRLINTST